MSRTKRALLGGGMTAIQLLVQILLQFAVAPMVLRFAGQEALGAFAAIIQCLSYMIAIDIGFYSILIKYLAHEYGREGVGAGFGRVMATARQFIVMANLIYAFALILLAVQAGKWLGLEVREADQARWGLLTMAVWTVARIPLSLPSFALVSVQDLAFRNGIAVLSSIVRFGVSLSLVALGFGLGGLILGYIASDVIEQICCVWRFRTLYPLAGSMQVRPDRDLLREMLRLSGSTLLIMIGSRFLFFSDNLIVGVLTSAVAASIFYTTQMSGTFGWMTINRMTDNAAPAINELYAQATGSGLRAIYIRIHRYIFLLSLPFCLALLIYNQAIVHLWVGSEQFGGDRLNAGLACLSIVVTVGWVDYVFLLAGGNVQIYALVYFGAAVLKFVLSVVLCRIWGPAGVLLATIPAALAYVAFGQYLACRRLALNWGSLMKSSFLPCVPAALVTAGLMECVSWSWPAATWFALVGQCATFLMIYVVLAWFSLPRDERSGVRSRYLRQLTAFKSMFSLNHT